MSFTKLQLSQLKHLPCHNVLGLCVETVTFKLSIQQQCTMLTITTPSTVNRFDIVTHSVVNTTTSIKANPIYFHMKWMRYYLALHHIISMLIFKKKICKLLNVNPLSNKTTVENFTVNHFSVNNIVWNTFSSTATSQITIVHVRYYIRISNSQFLSQCTMYLWRVCQAPYVPHILKNHQTNLFLQKKQISQILTHF